MPSSAAGACAEIDPLFTMRPPLGVWLFIILNASRVHRNAPVRLTSTTFRHCSTVSSSMGIPGALAPALLNRKSSRPNASAVLAKSACTDAGSLTSAGTASARSPSAPASSLVFSSGSGRRPASTTDHPSRSIASAQARPIPVPAPVIIATFPFPFILPSPYSRRMPPQRRRACRRHRARWSHRAHALPAAPRQFSLVL